MFAGTELWVWWFWKPNESANLNNWKLFQRTDGLDIVSWHSWQEFLSIFKKKYDFHLTFRKLQNLPCKTKRIKCSSFPYQSCTCQYFCKCSLIRRSIFFPYRIQCFPRFFHNPHLTDLFYPFYSVALFINKQIASNIQSGHLPLSVFVFYPKYSKSF